MVTKCLSIVVSNTRTIMKTCPGLNAAIVGTEVLFLYRNQQLSFDDVRKQFGVDPVKYAKWLIANRKPFGEYNGMPVYRTSL